MRRRRVMLLGLLPLGATLFVLLGMPACYSNVADDSPGDPPVPVEASVLGNGARIYDIAPPNSHQEDGGNVYITGVSLITVDNYCETSNGKSTGSVYVQDFQSHRPYSGITLYKPTYTPANLILAPGDVIDITGVFQDYAYDVGQGGGFEPYQTTAEAYEPVVTFRLEFTPPTPTVIQASDLMAVTPQASYELGQRWLSMLVEVDDVTLTSGGISDEGRVSYYFTSNTTTNGPVIANQLYNLSASEFEMGQHFSKVIGVVNFFYNFSISPRSPADLVP
jgi:hypothetical protein